MNSVRVTTSSEAPASRSGQCRLDISGRRRSAPIRAGRHAAADFLSFFVDGTNEIQTPRPDIGEHQSRTCSLRYLPRSRPPLGSIVDMNAARLVNRDDMILGSERRMR